MEEAALTTVVVGYNDTETALEDFQSLETAHKDNRLPSYDAAVVERADSTYRLVATTVVPSNCNAIRAAGLGLVAGVFIAPALAAAIAGAALGGSVGTIIDRFESVSEAKMVETRRLVDGSAANLVIIVDSAHAKQIESIAASRPGRTVIPFSPADIDVLRRELRMEHGRLGA